MPAQNVNRTNIGVLKRVDRLECLAHTFHFRLKALNIAWDELDGDVPISIQIPGFPDLSQTAASDFFFKPKAVKFRTGRIRGRPFFRSRRHESHFTGGKVFGHWGNLLKKNAPGYRLFSSFYQNRPEK